MNDLEEIRLLKKALNKANLVKARVQVHRKDGVYERDQWVRPNVAIKGLKHTLKQTFEKQGKKIDVNKLIFTDKKTKKSYGYEELTKIYAKNGYGQLLQNFVRKNFTIGQKSGYNKNTKEYQLTSKRLKQFANNPKKFTEYVKANIGDERVKLDKPVMVVNEDYHTFAISAISKTENGNLVYELDLKRNAYGFSKALRKAYDSSREGKQVTPKSAKELKDETKTAIINEEMNSGAIVTNHGEISAVFAKGGSGFVKKYFPTLKEKGGYWVNCFNTYLPRIYEEQGFKKVASIPFNEDFLPKEFDKNYMYSKFKDIKNGLQFMSLYEKPFKKFEDWDEAEKYTINSK